MMTVKDLTEMLSEMPEDAPVCIKHQLVGNEQYAERIALEKDGCVWIYETND